MYGYVKFGARRTSFVKYLSPHVHLAVLWKKLLDIPEVIIFWDSIEFSVIFWTDGCCLSKERLKLYQRNQKLAIFWEEDELSIYPSATELPQKRIVNKKKLSVVKAVNSKHKICITRTFKLQ